MRGGNSRTSSLPICRAYVGVGWVIWRDKDCLPKELVFELHYLGSTEFSFSLNFSRWVAASSDAVDSYLTLSSLISTRPAAPIIAQYFSLISLGFEGYRRIALSDLANARLLSRALEASGYYKCVSEIHKAPDGKDVSEDKLDDVEAYAPGLPVVAFRFSDAFQKKYPHIQQKWIQTLLRAKGWISREFPLMAERRLPVCLGSHVGSVD